jgi:hypothetical protein
MHLSDRVRASRLIRQSPLGDAPDVPAGTLGFIQDEVAGVVYVDFGYPWGVVICDKSELSREGA